VVIVVSAYAPDRETIPGTAIVMANSFNGSVSRGFGRKAQAIANITGIPVYAYDRRGTGINYGTEHALRKELKPSHAIESAKRIGAKICGELDSSVKSVVLYGHSGAGPEMAALARGKELPTFALSLSDPVGIRRLDIVRGAIGGVLYNVNHEWPAKRAHPSEHNGSSLRFLRYKKFGRALLEAYNYKAMWGSDFTLRSIEDIAENQPDISIFAAFASESIDGKPAFVQTVVDRINSIRSVSSSRPIEAVVWPDTLHSSFENPGIASEVIMRTWQMSSSQPEAA